MVKKHDIYKNKKIAIFQFFLAGNAVGGAERLLLELKVHLGCDFWVGGIDSKAWNKDNTDNPFVKRLFETKGEVYSIHEESKIPVWRVFKRFFYQIFSPKIKQLKDYDLVIYNFGNVLFVPQRLGKKVSQMGYCNCPPRYATDQFDMVSKKFPFFIRPIFWLYCKIIMHYWKQAFNTMDYKIANSKNIQQRVKEFTGIEVDRPIFPPVDVERFKWIRQGDYFVSFARLEKMKRIDLIIEAFKQMPDKKLVLCSGGPIEEDIKKFIKDNNLTNIDFRGRVSDEMLAELVGKSLAGIYIPINEDAGMTQLEILAAGKPVIGVREGGLIESLEDDKNGIVLPPNPDVSDLVQAIQKITPEYALSIKEDCIKQAQKFSKARFLREIDESIEKVLTSNKA
jgi:glycosyltransferase involved in cell wall biosynthesis